MAVVDPKSLLRIATAFQLGDKHRDEFGARVISSEKAEGFITRITHDNVERISSKVILHDGARIHYHESWSSWGAIGREDIFSQKIFVCPGATYAAVELNGMPERVFLFHTMPGFNLGYIMEKLFRRRAERKLPLLHRDLNNRKFRESVS